MYMRIPEIYIPLFHMDILEKEWHDTFIIDMPANSSLTMRWHPTQGMVYLVYGLTMGRPRDYITRDIIVSTDFGFYVKHEKMKWHWNPLMESIFEVETPFHLIVTHAKPLVFEFYNNTDLRIVNDFTLWLFECANTSIPILNQYLRGLFGKLILEAKKWQEDPDHFGVEK